MTVVYSVPKKFIRAKIEHLKAVAAEEGVEVVVREMPDGFSIMLGGQGYYAKLEGQNYVIRSEGTNEIMYRVFSDFTVKKKILKQPISFTVRKEEVKEKDPLLEVFVKIASGK